MRTVTVTRTYLEITSKKQFKAKRRRPAHLRIERVFQCAPSFYKFMYTEIGRANYWTDRIAWSEKQIRRHLTSPRVSLWLMTCHGGPAGYFELVKLDDGGIEINYLGLLPEFQGRGLGQHLLTAAVQTCWKLGAKRVQLDTCSLDHPGALTTYLKRGFVPYQTERFYRMLPTTPAEEKRFRTTGTKGRAQYG